MGKINKELLVSVAILLVFLVLIGYANVLYYELLGEITKLAIA